MSPLLSAIFLIVIALAFLVGFSFTAISIYLVYLHWKYRHLPGPKRDSFFSGNLALVIRNQEKGKIFHQLMQEFHSTYGPVVVMWIYHLPFIFVTDPELTKQCLVTLNLPKSPRLYTKMAYTFGQRFSGNGLVTVLDHDLWKKHRSLINPAFHRRYLMNLMSAFNSSCNLFLNHLNEMADGKTVVDMAEEFARVTLDVIGKVAFNVDVDADSIFPSAISKVFKGIQESLQSPFWRVDFTQFPFQRSVIQAAKYLRNYATEVIKERQKAVSNGDDVPRDILSHILNVAEAEPTLTMEHLVDEFITFFIAGQETTSNQLSFTLHEILKHPHIEDRIVQEINCVLGCRQFVEYKDLGNLQYLGQSLKEGLRLHPTVNGTSRIATKDEMLGEHFIPAGSSVTLSWYVLHRLPELWPEPEKFDPDRFSPDAKNSSNSLGSAYFPFSMGPRTCIGQTFAQFEARVLMARLLQEFKLTLLPGQNEIQHEERLTMRPKGGVLCLINRKHENEV
ncbi:cholesterol 24-hydroxylase-like [Montipora capricornis]|uniref:cholesterol 24-hydroxylase-like n=1 Tax=Montipora capricornis TaxID=246305 RepID=UPI0035F1085F